MIFTMLLIRLDPTDKRQECVGRMKDGQTKDIEKMRPWGSIHCFSDNSTDSQGVFVVAIRAFLLIGDTLLELE